MAEPSQHSAPITPRDLLSKWAAAALNLWIGSPESSIFFGQGIGDDLLCTAVARELKRRDRRSITLLSRYGELFENNPDIDRVRWISSQSVGRLRRWGHPCHVPNFSHYDEENDRDIFLPEHLITTMCRLCGMTGPIDIRPYLFLRPEEKAKGRLFEQQIAIQSGGLQLLPLKSWFADRYQTVSNELGQTYTMVQLGQKEDPPLAGVVDLRGKTTLRESAAILANSLVFVGQVGFLMHLARAVDCRSAIVYGGREDPLVSGYTANENLIGRVECAPCWRRNRCDYDRACMRMIEPAAVIEAARRQIKLLGEPLFLDKTTVSPLP
ncbi:hypothetical protein BH09VER1_BH09VER1_00170 [soil metagenome]